MTNFFLSNSKTKILGKGNSRQIIKGISGNIPAGSLVAIMGSSGAGKSTMMNVLAGRNLGNLEIEGKITVNDEDIGARITNLSGVTKVKNFSNFQYIKFQKVRVSIFISAYVQQDDIFIGSMTVKEHLMFHAALQMSRYVFNFDLF